MTRRRVVCVCSRESEPVTEHELRREGWRVVEVSPADAFPLTELLRQWPHTAVFVWACPDCTARRNVQLRAS